MPNECWDSLGKFLEQVMTEIGAYGLKYAKRRLTGTEMKGKLKQNVNCEADKCNKGEKICYHALIAVGKSARSIGRERSERKC